MMKKSFTLLEMLLVMAIIGILTAILIPLLSRVQNTSKVNQAKTEVNTIKMSIDAYYNDYGCLPYDGDLKDQTYIGSYSGSSAAYGATVSAGEAFVTGSDDQVRNVEKMYTIIQMPCDNSNPNSSSVKCKNYVLFTKKNPNSIRYLPPSYAKWSLVPGGCSKATDWHTLTKAYDPWDRPYLFYLDGDADGQINVHPSFNLVGNKLSNHVGVVSLGSRLKGTVDEVLSKKKDIVTSW